MCVNNFTESVTYHTYLFETCFISLMFLRLIRVAVCISGYLFYVSGLAVTVAGFICRVISRFCEELTGETRCWFGGWLLCVYLFLVLYNESHKLFNEILLDAF